MPVNCGRLGQLVLEVHDDLVAALRLQPWPRHAADAAGLRAIAIRPDLRTLARQVLGNRRRGDELHLDDVRIRIRIGQD